MKGFPWLLLGTGAYFLLLAAITALNWSGADRYWLGALNLYLPQFMWAIPGIVLLLFLLRTHRSWFWICIPLLCIAWVLGPLMGLHWSSPPGPVPGQAKLRVMTWNIKYGSYRLAPLLEELARCQPDVVLFQDAVDAMHGGPLADYFKGWQVRSHGQYVIASRCPLSDLQVREMPRAGEGQQYLRCRLQLGSTAIAIYNVHFKTPRRSLNAFRTARKDPWYLSTAIATLQHNVETRLLQADAVADALKDERGPVVLAGDLNSPDVTRVCGTLRAAGLRDAFDEKGRGYGFTYGHLLFKYRLPWLRVSWMRIDHIMSSEHFRIIRCWAGTGGASDHRPVLADLVIKGP